MKEVIHDMEGNVDNIIDELYIGDYNAAMNQELLLNLGIRNVLSLDVCRPQVSPSLNQLFISISDECSSALLPHLPACLQFLAAHTKHGVLVHCRHGVSRSAAVVTAFLASATGCSMAEALLRLQQLRPPVSPNEGFLRQLQLWEQMGATLDLSHPQYQTFLLESGLWRPQALTNYQTMTSLKRVRCKKCGTVLAFSQQIIQHILGHDLSWKTSIGSDDSSLNCKSGVFLAPLDWMPPPSYDAVRLLCPKKGCNNKLGSVGGTATCSCKAKLVGGAVLTTSRIDLY